jgi:hypothetical protein
MKCVFKKEVFGRKNKMFKRKQNVADLTIAEGKTILQDTN